MTSELGRILMKSSFVASLEKNVSFLQFPREVSKKEVCVAFEAFRLRWKLFNPGR